jgi:hypothetical protein
MRGLQSDRTYRLLLLKAFFTRTLCADMAIIAQHGVNDRERGPDDV